LPSLCYSSIDTITDKGNRQFLAEKKDDLTLNGVRKGMSNRKTGTISDDWSTGVGYGADAKISPYRKNYKRGTLVKAE
jgi:hypothetical protein